MPFTKTERSFIDAAVSNTPVVVSDRAARLTMLVARNTGAECYLQIFDSADADVTVGDPKYAFPIMEAGLYELPIANPKEFSNGIVIAATSTSDGDGAPDADLFVVASFD